MHSADDDHAALRAYYARGEEQQRLSKDGVGRLEFERTTELIARHLPGPPARVADVGGGPGRYALWLAEAGYEVEHRDLIELHVEQLQAIGARGITARVGDARRLDLATESVDAVLLLGPLYHLTDPGDRIDALREAGRVLRPGGVVLAAVISRWATRLDGFLTQRLYRSFPRFDDAVVATEATGRLPPVRAGAFTAHTHRPEELAAEITAAGLGLRELVAVEGPAGLLPDLDERMLDDTDRQAILHTARALESVPEVIGASPHLLAVAARPGAAGDQP